MLWNASALNGLPIKAMDDNIGAVADLIYDPLNWAIRWLAVDTGDWLSGRGVLLPVAALDQPDPEAHHLPVTLTMKQVADSPDLDEGDPRMLKSEGFFRKHFSPLSIAWIDWARSIIHLDVTRQKVKDSPPYVAAETVDGAFEYWFQTYYGFRWTRR